MRSETHAGEDVAAYARGPGAQAVHGSIEQNVLFHVLVQANPPMRDMLCSMSACDSRQVSLELPRLDRLPAPGQRR